MNGYGLLAVLVLGVIVLTPAAGPLRVPQPILLTVLGLLLAALPFTPELSFDPGLILPVVLPPLLFAATQRTTVTEFRRHAGAVLYLAVGLTVTTAALVAVVGHLAGLSWSVAWVLGAVVSPPDPVAATAVARRLRLPERLVTVLEGEGMFNDATALVLYKVALVAVVTGDVTLAGSVLELALGVVVGVAAGLAGGVVARLLLGTIRDGYAETTVTVLVPYLAYVGAEHLHGSGVLAVLTVGLYLRSYGHDATTSQGWLLGRAVWSYADFLVTSLVFALLGYELVKVVARTDIPAGTLGLMVAVVATLVAFRAVWVGVGGGVVRHRARARDLPMPSGWRESAVVAWAGMRGVVTVAAVLALPMSVDDGSAFPDREQVLVVALACVLVTLLVQGLSLAPLTSWLGVGSEADESHDVVRLRREAAQAALDELHTCAPEDLPVEVRRAAVLQYKGYLAAQEAMEDARVLDGDDQQDSQSQLEDLLRHATDVERGVVLGSRRRGDVSAAVADEVLRDVEGRAVRDFGA